MPTAVRPAGPGSARRRPPVAARRAGYVIAALVNVGLLYAVNSWPGWESVGFLTGDTRLVLGLVNASIVVGVLANLVYLWRDPVWLKALGDVVTTSVGLAAAVRLWQVFPFDFGTGFDWTQVVRVVLVVGIVGSAIGILVAASTLVRSAVDGQGIGGRIQPRH